MNMKKVVGELNWGRGIATAIAILWCYWIANSNIEYNSMVLAIVIFSVISIIVDLICVFLKRNKDDTITIKVSGEDAVEKAEIMFKSVYDGTGELYVDDVLVKTNKE